MQVLTTIEEFREAKAAFKGTWGFVPTMGYLHAGHVALVKRARAENDHVAVSIFVNPTQFGPNEDFAAYPRDLQRDLDVLQPHTVDLVFNPTPEVMYPPHFQTYVTVEEVTRHLEGAARPVHFRGVATVVTRLFNIVGAERAYFGQKDAQQTIVIKRLVADLAMPIQVVVCPTIREPDGLAMSSRNTYLNAEQRKAAQVLYRALCAAKGAYDKGERNGKELRATMRRMIDGEPLASIDYVSAADPETLQELPVEPLPQHRQEHPVSATSPVHTEEGVLLSMAVRFGRTRLIDNFLYDDGQWLTGEFAD